MIGPWTIEHVGRVRSCEQGTFGKKTTKDPCPKSPATVHASEQITPGRKSCSSLVYTVELAIDNVGENFISEVGRRRSRKAPCSDSPIRRRKNDGRPPVPAQPAIRSFTTTFARRGNSRRPQFTRQFGPCQFCFIFRCIVYQG